MLFDLDDTLTNRPRSVAGVAERMAVEFAACLGPCDVNDICLRLRQADAHGYRSRTQFFADFHDAIAWLRPPGIERIGRFWNRQFPLCTVAAEGMMPALQHLHERGMRLGIVTNGGTAMQNAKIDRLSIRPLLTSIVISESAGVDKPDSRIFEIALAEVGLSAHEVAFVGDHPVNDIAGSQSAGMTGIWLPAMIDWPADVPPPQFTIRRLHDLRSLLL